MDKLHRVSFRRDESFTLESCLLPLQQHENKKEIDLSAIVERLTDAPLEPGLFAKYLHHQLNLLAGRLQLRLECPGIGAQYVLARRDAAFSFRIALDTLKGTVTNVDVCIGDKSISCSHLVEKLNGRNLDDLTDQISSLNEFCDQPFDGNLRRQLPALLQSLQIDIDNLCAVLADEEPAASVNSCQIGRLLHKGCSLLIGRPQRLLLYRLGRQHHQLLQSRLQRRHRQLALPPVELTATVGIVDSATPHILPVIPIVTLTRTGPSDRGTPTFSQLTANSSCPVRAAYCLRLDRPLPISQEQLDRLQAITGVPVPLPAPEQQRQQPTLLALIADSLDQPDLSTEIPLRVSLSDQLALIRCTQKGHVIRTVPFTNPAVLAQVSALLRQQFVLNQLLASSLQLTPQRANFEPGVTCFEFEVASPTRFRLSIMRGLSMKRRSYSLELSKPDFSPACRRLSASADPGPDGGEEVNSAADVEQSTPSAEFLERAIRLGGLSLPLAIRRLQRLRDRQRPRSVRHHRRRLSFAQIKVPPATPQHRLYSVAAVASLANSLVQVKGVTTSIGSLAKSAASSTLLASRPRFCLEAPAPQRKRHPLGPPQPVDFTPPHPLPHPGLPPYGGPHHPQLQHHHPAPPPYGLTRQLSHPAGVDGGGSHHHHHPPHHYGQQFQQPYPQQHQLYQHQQLVGGQATPPHLPPQYRPHLSHVPGGAGGGPGFHQRMPIPSGYHGPPTHSQTPPYAGVQQYRSGGQPFYPGSSGQSQPQPPQASQQQQPHPSYHAQFANATGPTGPGVSYGPPQTPPSYVQMPPASPHHHMLGSPAPQQQQHQPHTPQPHTPHTPQPLHHPATPAAVAMEIGGPPGTPMDQQLISHHHGDSGGGGSGGTFTPLPPAQDKTYQNPVLISLLQDDQSSSGNVPQSMPMPQQQQQQQQQHRQMFPNAGGPPGYGQQQQQPVYNRAPATQRTMTSPQQQQQPPQIDSAASGGAKAAGRVKKQRKPRTNPAAAAASSAPSSASMSTTTAPVMQPNRMGPGAFDPQQQKQHHHHLNHSLDNQAPGSYISAPGMQAGPQTQRLNASSAVYDSNVSRMAHMTEQLGASDQHHQQMLHHQHQQQQQQMRYANDIPTGSGFPAQQHHMQAQHHPASMQGMNSGHGHLQQQQQQQQLLHQHQQQTSSSNGLVLLPGSDMASSVGVSQSDEAASNLQQQQQQQSLRLTIPKNKIGAQDQAGPNYASAAQQKNPGSVYDFDPAKEEANKASSVESRKKPLKMTIRMNAATTSGAASAADPVNSSALQKPADPTAAVRRPSPPGKPNSYAFHQQNLRQQQQQQLMQQQQHTIQQQLQQSSQLQHPHQQHLQERAMESSGTDSAPASVEDISSGALDDQQLQMQHQQLQQLQHQQHQQQQQLQSMNHGDESNSIAKQQLRKKLEKGRRAENAALTSSGSSSSVGQLGNNGRQMPGNVAASTSASGSGPGASGMPAGLALVGGMYGAPAQAKKRNLAAPHPDKPPQAKKSKKHRRLDAASAASAAADASRLSTPSSSAGASPATPADSAAVAAPSASRQNPALKSFKIPRKNTATDDSSSAAGSSQPQQQLVQPPPPPPRFPQSGGFTSGPGGIRQQYYPQQQQQQQRPPLGSAYPPSGRQMPMQHPQQYQMHHRPMPTNLFDQIRHQQQQQQQHHHHLQQQHLGADQTMHHKDTPDSPTDGPASPSPGGGSGGVGGGGGSSGAGHPTTVSIIPHN